jgi:hypothetical protein
LRFSGPGHYLAVLLLTLTSFVFLAAAPDEDWAPLVSVLIQGATLLVALHTSEVSQRLIRAAWVVVTLGAVSAAATLLGGSTDARASGYIVNMLLVALAPPAIAVGVVRQMRIRRGVTLQAVFGVLSIYVLIGMFFAAIYLTIDQLSSEPFFAGGVAPSTQDFQYFSFVTQTTVGYGDLTAATSLGRTLAVFEALIGQIYLVTIVAALMANLRPRALADDEPQQVG